MAESDFREKFFSGRKYRKYAGTRHFCRFSLDFFLLFRCFFRSKILLITMPTIKHSSIVNKTFFEPGTFQKSPEHPIFAGKTVFLEFLGLYFIFIHEILHTDAKWQCLKCDGARFSKNIFFRPKMPEIMPEKPVFWHFLEISSLICSYFLHKDAY